MEFGPSPAGRRSLVAAAQNLLVSWRPRDVKFGPSENSSDAVFQGLRPTGTHLDFSRNAGALASHRDARLLQRLRNSTPALLCRAHFSRRLVRRSARWLDDRRGLRRDLVECELLYRRSRASRLDAA